MSMAYPSGRCPSVEAFDFADADDSLVFYDGDSVNAPVLHYYTGENAIVNDDTLLFYDNYFERDEIMIQSTGNAVLVVFTSGDCFRGLGFSLTYESSQTASFCDAEFEQTLTLETGLVSQRQKGGYRDSSDCFFFITPPSATLVYVEFLQFDLASEDFVEFIDETGTTSVILATFHGNDDTFPVQSIGNRLVVHFVSNESLYDKGFILRYQSLEEPLFCLPLSSLNEATGTIRSHQSTDEYSSISDCSWAIQANAEEFDSIYLYFSTFDVPPPATLVVSPNNAIAVKKSETTKALDEPVLITETNQIVISDSPSLF
eukprot:CAMPEP_0206192812 /NCGR_PEP_ID=MMETSP0166-20121206/6182_1 /ASSEMBLY_ACC=CAM_ASM_000260 /TAXON_ID=95228 /ORGANISM="Vannella robusta, Strain DIVA3 518/3/11/1/6" /LENGTH=315 /DNA_ID=CAMNT_0053609381 /DNA_START=653 /DNA_END=1597 /DNA_ORIENTATION=-